MVPQFLPRDAHVTRAHTGGGSTNRYPAVTFEVKFWAKPTITRPSAETASANRSCQPPRLMPALVATVLRFCRPLLAVQRIAIERPPGGGGVAVPTTTLPSAETLDAVAQPPPRSPRSCMPPAAVHRNGWNPPMKRDNPTTTDPSEDVAIANDSPPPRLPRSWATPAFQRNARDRNVLVSYESPTITVPSADTALARLCISLGSVARISKPPDGVNRNARVMRLGCGEVCGGTASPTMTDPVADIPKARLTLKSGSFGTISVPMSCTPVVGVRMNARRNAVDEDASPTIREPSADSPWPSASKPLRSPRSWAPVAAVQMNVRVQPPKTWQRGSRPARKYLPMMTLPSAETCGAS